MSVRVECADALDFLRSIDDGAVNLIATDPPYFRVVDEEWDKAWSNVDAFLAWLGEIAGEWQRVLAPNGSLYCFASPKLAARVQREVIAPRFEVLNEIVWAKPGGRHAGSEKEVLRSYFPQTERIIFAEQFGADGSALRGSGYDAACSDLRAGVFEPLRAYLASERDKAGWSTRRVAEEYQKVTGSRTVTGMAGHWFECSQWTLPTEANYLWLRCLFNREGGSEYLRREYEDLRREYEDLRRPFNSRADAPYTDVWTFATVPPRRRGEDRHPCAKPVDLMSHIVEMSSRPGDVVLDCFAGSGATAVATVKHGRTFIGCDKSSKWVDATLAAVDAIGTEPEQLAIGAW